MRRDAWHGVSELSLDAAQRQYVAVVDALCPGWRATANLPADCAALQVGEEFDTAATAAPEQGAPGSLAFSPAVSRMQMQGLSEEEEAARVAKAAPLQLAVEDMDLEAVQALLAQGADPNVALNEVGESALHIAVDHAREGGLQVAQALLDSGADPNAAEPEAGQTPLMYAVLLEPDAVAVQAVRMLRAAGARLDVEDADGGTVQAVAADAGVSEEVLGALLGE